MIDPQSLIARSPQLLSTALGNGDLALLSLSNEKYFSANPLGRRIWELLESPRTAAQLQTLIVTEYDVSAEQCKADLDQFLDQMIGAKLLTLLS
jgi:hypothetical protein